MPAKRKPSAGRPPAHPSGETRSTRVDVLLRPSVIDKLWEVADALDLPDGASRPDAIEAAIEEAHRLTARRRAKR